MRRAQSTLDRCCLQVAAWLALQLLLAASWDLILVVQLCSDDGKTFSTCAPLSENLAWPSLLAVLRINVVAVVDLAMWQYVHRGNHNVRAIHPYTVRRISRHRGAWHTAPAAPQTSNGVFISLASTRTLSRSQTG